MPKYSVATGLVLIYDFLRMVRTVAEGINSDQMRIMRISGDREVVGLGVDARLGVRAPASQGRSRKK
jgi:hypothetical protein